MYNQFWMHRAQNVAKVPTAIIRISDFMQEVDDGDTIKIVFPENLSAYTRQYDPSFITPYARAEGGTPFSKLLETADVDAVLNEAGKAACDYVVTFDWDVIRAAWEEKGYMPTWQRICFLQERTVTSSCSSFPSCIYSDTIHIIRPPSVSLVQIHRGKLSRQQFSLPCF